jgi:hypothetical protein
VAVAAAAAIAACNTPSVPIPPPDPQAIAFDFVPDEGFVTFSYAPNANFGGAIVYVFNRDQGVGIIDTARDDGSVGPTMPFPAIEGDDVLVTFEADDTVGRRCVEVHDGPSSFEYECEL